MKLDEQYWSNRYEDKTDTWDTGTISTPLKEYFDQLQDKSICILIPGCGNSHEARYLLENGFHNITLIDISSLLCHQLNSKLGGYVNSGLQIICCDFFEHIGQYDLVVEQTFFCALEPAYRNAYAQKMKQLVKPDGKLAGLLFNKNFEVNPPFGGDEIEYRQLFQPLFNIEIMEECYNSIAPRKGTELFVKMVNR